MAPIAMQKMAHQDGERGTMGAAAANGMGMVRRRGAHWVHPASLYPLLHARELIKLSSIGRFATASSNSQVNRHEHPEACDELALCVGQAVA